MLAQPLRTSDLRVLPSQHAQGEPKVAVLLNKNARRVTDRVVKALTHVIPEEDLFLSRSAMDARRIAQTVLERRYHTVFCGGGDGTFMGFVNEVLRQVEQRSRFHPQPAPRFGVLKLGTGNGVATLVNASPLRGDGILDDVLRARANEVPGYRRMDLLNVDGQRAQFAGLGVDGKVLNDYIWVKDNLGKGSFLKRAMSGSRGYFASVALRTVPHYFANSTFSECEVRNGRSGPAYRLAQDGSAIEEVEPGGLLFRGRLMMAAAATMPFYGFGFRMFPFAGQRRRMMHLRLGAVHVTEVLPNLPKLWKGNWFPGDKILDFHASEVDVRFAREMPFQVAGDAAGYRDHVHFEIAPEQVELVDFSGAIN